MYNRGGVGAANIRAARLRRDLSLLFTIPNVPRDAPAAPQPEGFHGRLYDYQRRSLHRMLEVERDGVDFTVRTGVIDHRFKPRGGVICDVVGMGKTAQVIALTLASNHRTQLAAEAKAKAGGAAAADGEEDACEKPRKVAKVERPAGLPPPPPPLPRISPPEVFSAVSNAFMRPSLRAAFASSSDMVAEGGAAGADCSELSAAAPRLASHAEGALLF